MSLQWPHSHVGVLKRLKHTLPPRILYILYSTLILPHFNYGLILWWHDNARLHKLQKRAIRPQVLLTQDITIFINFTKAFDSIDRNLLYTKFMGYKISEKMLKMIVNIYSKEKSKVRTEGVSTGTFNLWVLCRENVYHLPYLRCTSTTLKIISTKEIMQE